MDKLKDMTVKEFFSDCYDRLEQRTKDAVDQMSDQKMGSLTGIQLFALQTWKESAIGVELLKNVGIPNE